MTATSKFGTWTTDPVDDMEEKQDIGPTHERQHGKRVKIRNLVAFWLLGLSNNYSFVVMLSAAYDILEGKGVPESEIEPPDALFNLTNATTASRFDCNLISTGAVLLADIIPEMIIDLSAPWFADYIPYDIRAVICVVAAACCFLVVALAHHVVAFSFMGVVFASISTGLGGFTFISLMSFYDKSVVSTWSSGTGASGLIGSLTYAGLTEVLTLRTSLLVMLIVPATTIVSYWVILVRAPTSRPTNDDQPADGEKQRLIGYAPTEGANQGAESDESAKKQHLTPKERLCYLKHLMKYMMPLLVVYVAQYFINQGLLEFIYFKGTWMTHQRQYRWFQVIYRLGVFVSRSSVNIVKFKRVWVLSILQWCVLVIMLTETYFDYMPSIAIVFAIIFIEGILGGAAYVNTFHQIRENVSPKYKEFAMGTTVLATAIGTSLAGAIAMPVHDVLCQL